MENLTTHLENNSKSSNLSSDSKYNNKKNRYINSYYTCFGVGCNHDWRHLPNLFQKRPSPQPIKEGWKHLNLEPKYYQNRCIMCSFLNKLYKDKNSIKELLRIYQKKGDNFKYTNEDQRFIKNIDSYNKLLDYEKKQVENLIDDTRETHNNSLAIELEDKFNKMKSYYDKEILLLKKRIKALEDNKTINVIKE